MGTMRVLPTKPFAALAGQRNGELDNAVLTPVPGGRLIAVTARKWLALREKCLEETGQTLHPTSAADTYRTLAVQIAVFTARYRPEPRPGIRPTGAQSGTRRGPFRGVYWWKVTGASAAVPGTSNHGRAAAIDAGILVDGKVVTITTDPDGRGPLKRVVDWLSDGPAYDFGFSWEVLPSEPWHLRDVTGDEIPDAVLRWEHRNDPPPPPPVEPTETFPPFAPEWGAWGLMPLVAHSDRPARLDLGSGYGGGVDAPWVSYLQGVLRIKGGQSAVGIHGLYDDATKTAVAAWQGFFRAGAESGVLETPDWSWVDFLAGTS